MKDSNKLLYTDIACRVAQESKARRLKVGAIIVKDDRIISLGCNGTKSGGDNNCEHEVLVTDPAVVLQLEKWRSISGLKGELPFEFDGIKYITKSTGELVFTDFPPTADLKKEYYELTTKHEVIHAEANALNRLCKSHESSQGASMFMSHSPCLACSMNIQLAGIKELYYVDKYRTTKGVDYLIGSGLHVEQVTS